MRKIKFCVLICSVFTLSACVKPTLSLQSNGVILWSNGVEERVQVSHSNDHLVFLSSDMMRSQVVVYSRINGASNMECEYYVNEPMPQVRLTVCGNGEVELLEQGQTLNIGQLTVFNL